MLYIEYNSSSVDFTYQIDGNILSVTPNAQYNGKYYLFLYGTDIVAGLRLLSTDGEFLTESYQLEFEVVEAEDQTEIVELVEVPNADDVTVDYTVALLSNTFSQVFSEDILQPFDQSITIEPFSGEVTTTNLTVTQTSNPLIWNGQNIVSGVLDQPNNQLVYLTFSNVQFASTTKSFDFLCVTQLTPYINIEYIRRQFGAYQQQINIDTLYYQQLAQMVKYEDVFGEEIIGISSLTPRQKMFLQQYQHLEVLKTMIAAKQQVAGDSISIDNFKVSYSQLNTSTLKYLQDMEDKIIQQFQDLRAAVASRGIKYINKNIHDKAARAVNMLYERIILKRVIRHAPIA